MEEQLWAFVEAYDRYRAAERDYLALGGFVAPSEAIVQERTSAYYAAAGALDEARLVLGEPPARTEGGAG